MKKTLFWTLLAAAFLFCMSCDTGSSSSDDPATTDQTTDQTTTDTSTGATTDTPTGTTGGTTTDTSTGTTTGTTTDTSTGTTTGTTTDTSTGTSTGTTTGDTTTPVTTYDCLKIAGTSAEAYGTYAIATQFSLAAVTDFTGGDYTTTFDVFIPSSSATISKLQLVYPNSAYDPMYFDTGAIETDKWVPVTIALTTANKSYGNLLSNSDSFRIYAVTATTGSALELYVKNVKIANGTATALSVDVTSTSDYSGNYAPLGTGVTVTTTKK